MTQFPHKARRYGYKLKKRFREDPFSALVLWALFFSAVFLIFAFRGLIATIFIKPIGILNPVHQQVTGRSETPDEITQTQETIPLQSTGTYAVKLGDTLYGIAVALQVDWEDLAALNQIEPPYSLSVGQELKLP